MGSGPGDAIILNIVWIKVVWPYAMLPLLPVVGIRPDIRSLHLRCSKAL
jgi:hypothetical protein